MLILGELRSFLVTSLYEVASLAELDLVLDAQFDVLFDFQAVHLS